MGGMVWDGRASGGRMGQAESGRFGETEGKTERQEVSGVGEAHLKNGF